MLLLSTQALYLVVSTSSGIITNTSALGMPGGACFFVAGSTGCAYPFS